MKLVDYIAKTTGKNKDYLQEHCCPSSFGPEYDKCDGCNRLSCEQCWEQEFDGVTEELEDERDKLKPCPFCAGKNVMEGTRMFDYGEDIYIMCKECGAKIQIAEEYGWEELRKRWNRRAGEQNV